MISVHNHQLLADLNIGTNFVTGNVIFYDQGNNRMIHFLFLFKV